jgi:hypothetical protein
METTRSTLVWIELECVIEWNPELMKVIKE